MKNSVLLAFIIGLFVTSCSRDEIIDTTPTKPVIPPAVDRRVCFHCTKHNLSYRFYPFSYSSKADSMPCPECVHDSAFKFLQKKNISSWQILCPKDSSWTTYNMNLLSSSYLSSSYLGLTWDSIKWFPTFTYNTVKGTSISDLTMIIKQTWVPTDLFNSFACIRGFFCDSCLMKVCRSAITTKTDSITNYHNYINGFIGINFTSYPFKTGIPVDRRARAQAILDSIQRILPSKSNSDYNGSHSKINWFCGAFEIARQHYLYCKKTGTPMGSYVNEETFYQTVSSDAYISDTVIINIAGGPDYANGGYYYIPTWKSKSNSQSVQNNTSRFPAASQKILSHGMPALSLKKKNKRSRSSASDSYQLLSTFQPGNVDLFPASYLPRKYNTYTTSVFNIFHPQKGNSTVYSSRGSAQPTWNFVDLFKTVGGTTRQWPYNITSDYYGELLNDVGVMEIRTVVNWCKARGKKIVLMGSSWGGAMIFDYIRYYGTSDFEQVVIADQNPNIPANIVSSEFETYIYQSGTQGVSTDMNPNMCVLSSDVYRRMEWLQSKNLSNVTFYCATTDTNVGMIPSADIATLKNQGAKVYAFPSPITHGVFQDSRAWYRYVTPTLQ